MKDPSLTTRHLKKIHDKPGRAPMRNIDAIYLINLDRKPERLEKSLKQCQAFQIDPIRFSAIDGWQLSQEVFNDLGVPVVPDMMFDNLVNYSVTDRSRMWKELTPDQVGKTCMDHEMSGGSLGNYLSHLSILADALDRDYETIWVLEDDFTMAEDPHILSDYIDELDRLVGHGGWDILYTDPDDYFSLENFSSFRNKWARPNRPVTEALLEYRPIGSFYQIGGRLRVHSLIVRRSAMQKILPFVFSEGIFRYYDLELSLIPQIQLFNLSRAVVHGRDRNGSDTALLPWFFYQK